MTSTGNETIPSEEVEIISASNNNTIITSSTESQVTTTPQPTHSTPNNNKSASEPDRSALISLSPNGFHLKSPPPPHTLSTYHTPTPDLFQTAHFGTAHLDPSKYTLKVSGLVTQPLTFTLHDLQNLPQTTLTATHECYGSPLNPPPTKALWRIGNVQWTGVRLSHVLALTGPLLPGASFLWASAPDHGTFGSMSADSYQKDMPLSKALAPEVLLAWEMNGAPLPSDHGGPVRLVVPGWFGTNSVKWVERIEPDPTNEKGRTRPVWEVQVNSMVVKPRPGELVKKEDGRGVEVRGWAWGCEDVKWAGVSFDEGESWVDAVVEEKVEFGWQGFRVELELGVGRHRVIAKARLRDGKCKQPPNASAKN
ncbi:hypothetical protein Q7P36_009182 [Cladosporium allicinum]